MRSRKCRHATIQDRHLPSANCVYKLTGVYAYRTRRRTEPVPCAQIAADAAEITLKFRSLAAGISIRNAKCLKSGNFALNDNPLP